MHLIIQILGKICVKLLFIAQFFLLGLIEFVQEILGVPCILALVLDEGSLLLFFVNAVNQCIGLLKICLVEIESRLLTDFSLGEGFFELDASSGAGL